MNRELVTLAECPPGPFLFDGVLGFKTEYGMTLPVPDDSGGRWEVTHRPDAYVMASGECFWGGATTHDERAALLVQPIDADDLAFADQEAPRVPVGWTLVPWRPTDDMLDQGVAALEGEAFVPPSKVWAAMIAAAPTAPQQAPAPDAERGEGTACPFCGSQDYFVERADFSSCYVICNNCGAHGPPSCDENDADAEASESGDCEPGELPARRLWAKRAATPDAEIAARILDEGYEEAEKAPPGLRISVLTRTIQAARAALAAGGK